MKPEDFQKQPCGPYAFDFYYHPILIDTPLGEFQVELSMFDKNTHPPTQEMATAAESFVSWFKEDLGEALDLVFKSYQLACERDPDWVEACDVPLGLKLPHLTEYIGVRSLTISEEHEEGSRYSACVYLSPQWDEEHGLSISKSDGHWTIEED